jgi:hypothetical protein
MRVKLSEQYPKEREEICNKIINILQLAPDNSFLLSELDANEEKQQAILEMKPEIQKYFAVSALTAYIPNKECARPALCIAKGILRQDGYFFEGKPHTYKVDGEYQKTTKYFIFKKPVI